MSSIMTKLPNNIIMNIIRMADGGLNTHKNKMNVIFEQIIGKRPVHWFEDGCVPPNLCPNYFPAIDDSEDVSDDEEENEEQYQCMCDNLCGTRLGINVPIACIYHINEQGRADSKDQTWCQTCWDDLKEEMNEEGWMNDDSSDDSSDDD